MKRSTDVKDEVTEQLRPGRQNNLRLYKIMSQHSELQSLHHDSVLV